MRITELKKIIREEVENALGKKHESNNYMFFANLKTLKHAIDEMLAMDKAAVDQILEDGHGWAIDHIATSTDDVEEVYHFLTNKDEIGHGDIKELSKKSKDTGDEVDIEKLTAIEVDGVNPEDAPKFSDSYVSSAMVGGVALTDEQLDWVNDNHPEIAQEEAQHHDRNRDPDMER